MKYTPYHEQCRPLATIEPIERDIKTHIHTFTTHIPQTDTLTLSHTLSLSHFHNSLSHTLSNMLTNTHSHSHFHTQRLTHTHTHKQKHSLSFTHNTNALTHTLTALTHNK